MTPTDPNVLLARGNCYRCIPKGLLGAVIIWLLDQWLKKKEPVVRCTDPIVDDWISRITLAGDPVPSDDQQQAVCRFVRSLRLLGLENEFYFLNPIVNAGGVGAINTVRHPLIYMAPGVALWTNFGFLDGDLDNSGLQGSSVLPSRTMDTGLSPGALPDWFNWSMFIQESGLRTGVLQDEYSLGVHDLVDVDFWMALSAWYSDGLGIAGPLGVAYEWADRVTAVQPDTLALYCATRTDATHLYLHRWTTPMPGVLLDTNLNDVTFDIPPVPTMAFMALHNVSLLDEYVSVSSKKISFAALSTALSTLEIDAFFNAIQDLRIALGGGNV